jgi:hypothetical protein
MWQTSKIAHWRPLRLAYYFLDPSAAVTGVQSAPTSPSHALCGMNEIGSWDKEGGAHDRDKRIGLSGSGGNFSDGCGGVCLPLPGDCLDVEGGYLRFGGNRMHVAPRKPGPASSGSNPARALALAATTAPYRGVSPLTGALVPDPSRRAPAARDVIRGKGAIFAMAMEIFRDCRRDEHMGKVK